MKILNVIICVALFLLGMWVGQFKKEIVVVTRTKRVEFLDFTAPDLMERLNVCVNTLGLTLQDRQAIIDLHRRNRIEIENLYRAERNKIENLRHKHYRDGYIEGVRSGRGR